MHTFSWERGAVRAVSVAFHHALWAGFGLALASVAIVVAGQARAAEPQPAMGDPVNLYAPNAGVYAPPHEDGEIHPQHVLGQIWLMTGEPGGSNVAVQVGNQGRARGRYGHAGDGAEAACRDPAARPGTRR
jgi:hypothetical protein